MKTTPVCLIVILSLPNTNILCTQEFNGCMDTQNNTNSQGGGDAAAGVDDGDTVSQQLKPSSELPSAPDSGLDGKSGPEHQHLQHDASSGEYIVPQTQPELVGHSIACAPYAYSDPYYGGVMTAYGAQNLVHPHLLGMHQVRLPLPLEMTEEPVYVNPKQYNGIMRRRQSRAKAELEKKLIKARKPYLHESRHQHAMRRQRGCGGRFLKTKQLNSGAKPAPEEGMGLAAAPSTESASPPGSAFTKLCTGKNDPSDVQEEIGGGLVGGNMSKQHTHSNKDANDSGCYQHHQDFRLSAYHPLASERGEEGDCSGQQRESILTRQTSQRTLTIQ